MNIVPSGCSARRILATARGRAYAACFKSAPVVCLVQPITTTGGNHAQSALAVGHRCTGPVAAGRHARPSASQAQKSPRETIHIGIIDRTFFYQPVLVAIQNGFFADEGLNANMRFIRSGEGQAEGLLKGNLHFALSSTEGIIQNVERGGPLRMLAANSGRLSHFIVTQKKFKKVEDLKGANVGILTMTEGSFFNWQEIALKHGLKYPDDYKVTADRRRRRAPRPPARRQDRRGPAIDPLGLCRRGRRPQQSRRRQRLCRRMAIHDLQRQRRVGEGQSAPRPKASCGRSCARPTGSIATSRMSAEIAAREMNIKPSYAERAWDYYTGTGTLTRDLAFSRGRPAQGVRRPRSRPGLLPASRHFDMSQYVAGGYLERARAAVAKD